MKTYLYLLCCLCLAHCAASQSSKNQIGGPCEGCEALHEYGNRLLTSSVTLPGFDKKGQHIKIEGTVFKKDGKTPAPGVILYFYQTDQQGKYTADADAKGWEKRHGSIRAWLKTDQNGRYTFYSLKPKAYPNRTEPAHIHLTVKEPGKKEYYLDSYYFKDDPLLSPKIRSMMRNRGGNGIIDLKKEGRLMVGKRDLILGLNIPYYH